MEIVINLNRFRKKKERAAEEKQAVENRVKYGRTKAQKDLEKLTEEQRRQRHEGHQKDDEPPAGA